MKFSARWLLAIVGLVFAALSVASILAEDNLLWGLDTFPLVPPPRGMGFIVAIAYITMLGSVGIMWFRAFVVKHVDQESLRLAIWFSLVSVAMHGVLVGYIHIWDPETSATTLIDPAAWEVASSASSVRALGTVIIGFPIQLWFARRDISREFNRWGVVVGGLIALGSLTVVGHTANQPPTWVSHGMDFVHGVGAAFWFGGMLGLVMFLRHALRQRDDMQKTARVLTDFSSYALFCVFALAISGSIMAVMVKDDPLEIAGSPFSRVLTLKLLMVVIPIALAVYNRFALMPHISNEGTLNDTWQKLRRSTLVEVCLLLVILCITGFLVLQSPVS